MHVCMHKRGLGKHKGLIDERDHHLLVLCLEFVREQLDHFEPLDGARIARAAAALVCIAYREDEQECIKWL